MTSIDPKLLQLLSLFPGDGLDPVGMEVIGAGEVPEPYRTLLVHRHHMTVTLEEHHRSSVKLTVLERRRTGDDYARKLILTAGPKEKVVLVGVMQLHLQHTKEEVRRAVLAEDAPLGRILIENDVLRWIEPYAYLRVALNKDLRSTFNALRDVTATFGRVAHIICHNSPAVELLEIVAPEEAI